MPKVEVPGAHFKFTDHRIRIVRPKEPTLLSGNPKSLDPRASHDGDVAIDGKICEALDAPAGLRQ